MTEKSSIFRLIFIVLIVINFTNATFNWFNFMQNRKSDSSSGESAKKRPPAGRPFSPQIPPFSVNPHFGFRRYAEVRYEPLTYHPFFTAPENTNIESDIFAPEASVQTQVFANKRRGSYKIN